MSRRGPPDLVSEEKGEWSEESIGQWSKSDKVLRKKVRLAQRFARERGSRRRNRSATSAKPSRAEHGLQAASAKLIKLSHSSRGCHASSSSSLL